MRLLARFWPSKLLIFLSLIGSSFAQPADSDDTWSADNFKFASKADGAEILGRSDEYVARLSRFDRSARLKTDKDISESDYLAFVSAQTLDWTDGEKSKVAEAAGSIVDALQKYNVPVTDVLLVRTTGKEEGNEAYTRGTAVFIPAKMMSYDRTKFRRLVAHELFHVISRTHPELRERLYAVIGYAKGGEIQLPSELDARRITNPDAPANDQYIRVKVDGDAVCATPILYASHDRYSRSKGGEFFDYLVFRYMLTWQGAGNEDYKNPADPELVAESELDGLFEQVGKNTKYTIHPDEILAVNFALLVTGEGEVKTPDVLRRMAETFASKGGSMKPPTAAEICR